MQKTTILLLGLGTIGKSLAAYFFQEDHRVWGLDDGDLTALQDNPNFTRLNAPQDFEDWSEVQRFFVSPGIPLTHPAIKKAKETGLKIENELDLAYELQQKTNPQAQIIAITGTNGKSTTTSLIGEILKKAGHQTAVGGNLGTPFLDLLKTEPKAEFYVLEISSFQAELSKSFQPHLAVFLNLSDDHLDRHPNMASYRRAKERLFQNMTEEDLVFYNADDLPVLESVQSLKTQKIPFSTAKKVAGAWADTEKLAWSPQGKILGTWEQSECSLKGLHNLENMSAAIAVAKILEVEDSVIGEVLKNFQSLPHRMSQVAEIEGVTYFNDSKATNVGATVMSLASFENKVILIMGGVDKGGSYGPLKALIRAKVKALITLGEAGPKIAKSLEGATKIYSAQDMKESVSLAKKLSAPGDTVLLSPACSSFDQYKNYAKRGEDFEKLIKKVKNI